jgi:predicted dehydrogenase
MRDPRTDVNRVAVVGCGRVATLYFPSLFNWGFLDVEYWCDVVQERANKAAETYRRGRVGTFDQVLASDDVDVVLNFTPPPEHFDVNIAALQAGKAVYSEKPFALSSEDAQATIDLAASRSLALASAPDTFLGAGAQTARRAIDQGRIGIPRIAVAWFAGDGTSELLRDETFPGTLLEIGPYYLTNLVNVLGPIREVAGMAADLITEATEGNAGGVNSHAVATLSFECGAIGVLHIGYGLGRSEVPHLEVSGTEGTIRMLDPNVFAGPVQIRPKARDDWQTVEAVQLPDHQPWTRRGIGVADMVCAWSSGRSPRASAELALHGVDVMVACEASSRTRAFKVISTTVQRPEPIRDGGFEELTPG